MFHILLALSSEERHGYGIMKQVEVDSQGNVSMGAGTLYGSLKRMLDAGLIKESDKRVDPEMDHERRIYYRITAAGAKALAAELKRYQDLLKLAQERRLIRKFWLMACDQKRVRTLYKKLLSLYPRAFREQLEESMEQTFNDLCNERKQGSESGFFGFVLWMFVETAVSAFLLSVLACIIVRAPIVRTMRAGGSVLAHPIHLILAVVVLSCITMVVLGIMVDQYPCWIGVPNCD